MYCYKTRKETRMSNSDDDLQRPAPLDADEMREWIRGEREALPVDRILATFQQLSGETITDFVRRKNPDLTLAIRQASSRTNETRPAAGVFEEETSADDSASPNSGVESPP